MYSINLIPNSLRSMFFHFISALRSNQSFVSVPKAYLKFCLSSSPNSTLVAHSDPIISLFLTKMKIRNMREAKGSNALNSISQDSRCQKELERLGKLYGSHDFKSFPKFDFDNIPT